MNPLRVPPRLIFTLAVPDALAAENPAPASAPTATAPKQSQAERRTASLLKELKRWQGA